MNEATLATLAFYPMSVLAGIARVSERQVYAQIKLLNKRLPKADFKWNKQSGGLLESDYLVWKRYLELLSETPKSSSTAIDRLKYELESI